MSMKDQTNDTGLRRVISLPLLVFYGLGNILGAGIYVLIGKIAGISGPYTALAFLMASVVVLFTALSYAELSSRYPVSAGEAVYIYEGIGSRKLSVATGIAISLSGMLSAATLIDGFYGYFSTFASLPEFAVSGVLVLLLTLVAVWGISQSVKAASLFTLVEVSGLLLVIYVAAPYVSWDSASLAQALPPLKATALNSILLGAFLAFYAFVGFEDMVNIAQEVKDPTRTMPKAIMLSLFITTVLYIAVAWCALASVPVQALASSDAPLALVYETATGKKAAILSVIGMFAVVNGALIQIIMVSRILYGMSKKGWLPGIFATVNSQTATPVNATVATAMSTFVLTLLLPLLTLAQSTSFLLLSIFTLVNISLIRIKLKDPHPKDVTTYPLWIPIAAVALNLIMIGFQVFSML